MDERLLPGPGDLEALRSHSQKSGVEILFQDVSFTINKGDLKKEKPILKGVTGIIKPRSVTAIFGPTGAGKTTLLDCLARRKRLSWQEGAILVNGQFQVNSFKRLSGYVVQDDLLIGSFTVRENILFSARLRLSNDLYTRADKERLVDEVIAELGLTHCRDTFIGNDLIRGVSGGERKRTNIACEFVMRPQVLFLDEPTSGLDSATAVTVISCVKNLAVQRHTTVCLSIHQPRFSIFKLFDDIILLSRGEVVYQGSPFKVLDHFASVGFHCEANNNPADFMFDALSGLSSFSTENINSEEILLESPERLNSEGEGAHNLLLRAYVNSETYVTLKTKVQQSVIIANTLTPNTVSRNVQSHASFGVGSVSQFFILCERYLLNMKRLPIIIVAQLVVMVFFAGIVGSIYWQVDLTFQGLQNRVGAIFFLIMSMIFSNFALEILIKERSLFFHQKNAGYFSTGPYFCATVICDLLPLRIFPMLVFGGIAYPCLGFKQEWEAFICISTAIASGSLCYLISSLIGVFAIANLAVSVCFVIQMLFGGLLVNLDTLPQALQWLKYLSLFQQGYSALAINELHGLRFKIAPFVKISGDEYLRQQGFGLDDRPMNLGFLLGSSLVYLFLGYLALRRMKKE